MDISTTVPSQPSPSQPSPRNTEKCEQNRTPPSPLARDRPPSSSSTAFDYLFKIVLVGDTGVGKSCLLMRFADDGFNDRMTATIGVDFRIRSMQVDGKHIKLQIWDSAGQERFRALTASYYRGAHAVAVVFDLSRYNSIDTVSDTWLDEIDKHCGRDVRKILIGNKSDLVAKRQVTDEHANSVAKTNNMFYVETSAKTSHNVYEAFKSIVTDIVQHDDHHAAITAGTSSAVRRRKRGTKSDDDKGSDDVGDVHSDDGSIVRISDVIQPVENQGRTKRRCC